MWGSLPERRLFLPSSPLMEQGEHGLSGVDELVGLEAEVIEFAGPFAQEAGHLLRTVVGDGLWEGPHVVPLHPLVEDGEEAQPAPKPEQPEASPSSPATSVAPMSSRAPLVPC